MEEQAEVEAGCEGEGEKGQELGYLHFLSLSLSPLESKLHEGGNFVYSPCLSSG